MATRIVNLTAVMLLLFYTSTQAKRVIVLNTTGKPPLNTPDGKGFMDQVAKFAFAKIGVQLTTIQLPAERGLLIVNAGIEDGEMSRIARLDKTYTNLVRVPEKIMDWAFVVFSKKDISLQHGWQSLQSHSVAIIKGWKILERNVPKNSELFTVKLPESLFGMLASGHADLIIYEKWGGLKYLKKIHNTRIRLLEPPLVVKEMFIYLHKKNADLIPGLAAAIQALKKEGIYQQLTDTLLTDLTRTAK